VAENPQKKIWLPENPPNIKNSLATEILFGYFGYTAICIKMIKCNA